MKGSKFRAIKKVLGFFESVLMGCFLACFRNKDSARRQPQPEASSTLLGDRDSLVSKNQLGSVFVSGYKDGGEVVSPCDGGTNRRLEGFDDDGIDEELEWEARYLKSCGAILGTPEEIWKASCKASGQISVEDVLSRNSHAFHLAECHADLQSSSNSDEQEMPMNAETVESTEHVPGIESGCQSADLEISPPQNSIKIAPLDPTDSSCPTPLTLTDKMQTPATIYPACMATPGTRKHARVRNQYVYPVLKPLENGAQLQVLREQSSQPVQFADHKGKPLRSSSPGFKPLRSSGPDFRDTPQQAFQAPVVEIPDTPGSAEFSFSKDNKTRNQVKIISEDSAYLNLETPKLVAPSLSHWLKPSSLDEEKENARNTVDEQPQSIDTSFKIVNATLVVKDDDHTRILHKFWDGNGIPNSTTKYKEDQKVNWHATPFEERLEKVLSDEKLLQTRKILGGRLIELGENVK